MVSLPNRVRAILCVCLLLLAAAAPANAQIGSPDTYLRTAAGPYTLLIGVHPPAQYPGPAAVEVRTIDSGVSAITIRPAGDDPVILKRQSNDQVFAGTVWMLKPNGAQLALHVSGSHGDADTTISIPPPTDAILRYAALKSTRLFWPLCAAALVGLGMFFWRRSRIIKVFAAIIVVAVFAEAGYFAFKKPTTPHHLMQVNLLPGGKLEIPLSNANQDLVPDHGYLMHLFAVRQPQMDVLLNLHPTQTTPGHFTAQLPPMPAGTFNFYADIVHSTGRPVTFTATTTILAQTGTSLQNDDSIGLVPGFDQAQPPFAGPGSATVQLADGFRMTLDLATALTPRTGELLGFTLLDPTGKPPADMQLYLGMPAHAIVLKTDNSVFIDIHPTGTILTSADAPPTASNQVSFPYGFPSAGTYRIFVQMKHGTTVETAAFDLQVR